MKRNRIALLIAGMLTIGSLAACGAQNASGNSGQNSAESTEEAGPADAQAQDEAANADNTAAPAQETAAPDQAPGADAEEDEEESTGGPGTQIANPWSEAGSMEEAAAGAGIEGFTLPHRYFDFGEPTFRYMKGAIDVDYDKDDVSATIRKIARLDTQADDGWDVNPQDEAQVLIGDYNEYAANWTETISGRTVHFSGGSEDKVNLVYWISADDACYYAVLFNSDEEEDGFPVYRMRSVIAQIDGRLLDAEPDDTPAELRDVLVGEWLDQTSQRALMEITEGEYIGEEDFCIKISWAGSYSEAAVWEMNASYDAQAQTLTYSNGQKANVTYAEDGSVAKEDVQWEGSDGTFVFEDGQLKWKDSEEDEAENFVFERVYAQDVSAEELTEQFLAKTAGLEEGTAGASLKAAAAAQEIASFASDHQIWNIKADSFAAAMQEAWEGMSEEDRQSFRKNFEGSVAELIDGMFNDYASVEGAMNDAGVGEAAKQLSGNEYARRSWMALRARATELYSN